MLHSWRTCLDAVFCFSTAALLLSLISLLLVNGTHLRRPGPANKHSQALVFPEVTQLLDRERVGTADKRREALYLSEKPEVPTGRRRRGFSQWATVSSPATTFFLAVSLLSGDHVDVKGGNNDDEEDDDTKDVFGIFSSRQKPSAAFDRLKPKRYRAMSPLKEPRHKIKNKSRNTVSKHVFLQKQLNREENKGSTKAQFYQSTKLKRHRRSEEAPNSPLKVPQWTRHRNSLTEHSPGKVSQKRKEALEAENVGQNSHSKVFLTTTGNISRTAQLVQTRSVKKRCRIGSVHSAFRKFNTGDKTLLIGGKTLLEKHRQDAGQNKTRRRERHINSKETIDKIKNIENPQTITFAKLMPKESSTRKSTLLNLVQQPAYWIYPNTSRPPHQTNSSVDFRMYTLTKFGSGKTRTELVGGRRICLMDTFLKEIDKLQPNRFERSFVMHQIKKTNRINNGMVRSNIDRHKRSNFPRHFRYRPPYTSIVSKLTGFLRPDHSDRITSPVFPTRFFGPKQHQAERLSSLNTVTSQSPDQAQIEKTEDDYDDREKHPLANNSNMSGESKQGRHFGNKGVLIGKRKNGRNVESSELINAKDEHYISLYTTENVIDSSNETRGWSSNDTKKKGKINNSGSNEKSLTNNTNSNSNDKGKKESTRIISTRPTVYKSHSDGNQDHMKDNNNNNINDKNNNSNDNNNNNHNKTKGNKNHRPKTTSRSPRLRKKSRHSFQPHVALTISAQPTLKMAARQHHEIIPTTGQTGSTAAPTPPRPKPAPRRPAHNAPIEWRNARHLTRALRKWKTARGARGDSGNSVTGVIASLHELNDADSSSAVGLEATSALTRVLPLHSPPKKLNFVSSAVEDTSALTRVLPLHSPRKTLNVVSSAGDDSVFTRLTSLYFSSNFNKRELLAGSLVSLPWIRNSKLKRYRHLGTSVSRRKNKTNSKSIRVVQTKGVLKAANDEFDTSNTHKNERRLLSIKGKQVGKQDLLFKGNINLHYRSLHKRSTMNLNQITHKQNGYKSDIENYPLRVREILHAHKETELFQEMKTVKSDKNRIGTIAKNLDRSVKLWKKEPRGSERETIEFDTKFDSSDIRKVKERLEKVNFETRNQSSATNLPGRSSLRGDLSATLSVLATDKPSKGGIGDVGITQLQKGLDTKSSDGKSDDININEERGEENMNNNNNHKNTNDTNYRFFISNKTNSNDNTINNNNNDNTNKYSNNNNDNNDNTNKYNKNNDNNKNNNDNNSNINTKSTTTIMNRNMRKSNIHDVVASINRNIKRSKTGKSDHSEQPYNENKHLPFSKTLNDNLMLQEDILSTVNILPESELVRMKIETNRLSSTKEDISKLSKTLAKSPDSTTSVLHIRLQEQIDRDIDDVIFANQSAAPLLRKERSACVCPNTDDVSFAGYPNGSDVFYSSEPELEKLIPVYYVFLLPFDTTHMFSFQKVVGAIDIAINKVEGSGLLPGCALYADFRNSHCSISEAMNEAISVYDDKIVDVFIGPVCDYAVAPIARQIRYWQKPLITPGALAGAFGEEDVFPFLIRMSANFNSMANMIVSILREFNWRRVKMVYDPDGLNSVMGRFCHVASDTIVRTVWGDPTIIKDDYKSFQSLEEILGQLHTEVGNHWAGLPATRASPTTDMEFSNFGG